MKYFLCISRQLTLSRPYHLTSRERLEKFNTKDSNKETLQNIQITITNDSNPPQDPSKLEPVKRPTKNRDLKEYKRHLKLFVESEFDGPESHKIFKKQMRRKQKKRLKKKQRMATAHRRTMATIYSSGSYSDSDSQMEFQVDHLNTPKSALKKSQYTNNGLNDSDQNVRQNRMQSKKSVRIANFHDASPEGTKKSHFQKNRESKESNGDGKYGKENIGSQSKAMFGDVDREENKEKGSKSQRRKTQFQKRKKTADFKGRQSMAT